ncbi:MAG: ABZJ_00895 family protein [Sulfurovaceae bacterium]
MAKYILQFGIYYVVAIVIVAIVKILLKIDSNSTSMVSIIFATMMTSMKFISENKRVPNSYEKKKLVWYSFAVTWAVSLILIVLILSVSGETNVIIELFGNVNYGLLLGVLLFVSVMEILILYFGYGWLAKKQYEGLVKKGKI